MKPSLVFCSCLFWVGLLPLPSQQLAPHHPGANTYNLTSNNGWEGTLPRKSFEVVTLEAPGHTPYRGIVSISPFCGINDGTVDRQLLSEVPFEAGQLLISWWPFGQPNDQRVKFKRLAGKEEDNPFRYSWAVYQHVSAVRVKFDKGALVEIKGFSDPKLSLAVPDSATKVISLEIDMWVPSSVNVFWNAAEGRFKASDILTHTVKWNEQETTSFCFWPSKTTKSAKEAQVAAASATPSLRHSKKRKQSGEASLIEDFELP